MPPYAIIRHAKVVDQKQAGQATAHNYRQYEVPNADRQALHPNVEFINTEQRDYWEVATERIAEAGITIRRKDAIRIEEIIITASPEFFERDEQGRAVDYSDSKWVKDSMTFLIEKYGAKNVIGFNLHQDEKSPHIHAMVVPITQDGRLSARDIFSPQTLKASQDEYGEAMKVHGLERGVKHSQAKHQDMSRMYGQQVEQVEQGAQLAGKELGPATTYQDVQVATPGRVQLDPEKWAAQQSRLVNEQARQQVEAANRRAELAEQGREAANKRAEEATGRAQANAAAQAQVRVLQKQLHTVERLKETHFEQVNHVAMRVAGGEQASEGFIKRGNRLLDQAVQVVKTGRKDLVQLHEQADQTEKQGDYGKVAELRHTTIPAIQKTQDEREANLRGYAGGVTRLDQLTAQQAQEHERQTQEREKQAREQIEKERQAIEQARKQAEDERQAAVERQVRAAEQAREQAERQRQQREADRVREKAQIERICLEIIPKNYATENYFNSFAREADKLGIEAKQPSSGEIVLSVKGSEHHFEHHDLQVGNQSFTQAYNRQHKTNWDFREQHERERGQGFGIGG